jgi:hypothetical protein
MSAGNDRQSLYRSALLGQLPLIALGRGRQRIQLSLVGGEGGPELGFIHRHAIGVQCGTINRNMLDPASPSASQHEEAFPDAWRQQSTYNRGQDRR